MRPVTPLALGDAVQSAAVYTRSQWKEIADRRAANMRLLAADLEAAGRLHPGVSLEEAADVLWSLNSPEFYLLLVGGRGWTLEHYEHWLGHAWQRLLLGDGASLQAEASAAPGGKATRWWAFGIAWVSTA